MVPIKCIPYVKTKQNKTKETLVSFSLLLFKKYFVVCEVTSYLKSRKKRVKEHIYIFFLYNTSLDVYLEIIVRQTVIEVGKTEIKTMIIIQKFM